MQITKISQFWGGLDKGYYCTDIFINLKENKDLIVKRLL